MKIGILGTGIVGQAHAVKLGLLGHDVVMGTKNVLQKLASANTEDAEHKAFSDWLKQQKNISLRTLEEASEQGVLVFNALRGEAALAIISPLAKQLSGKVLVDIANPLDFSKGMPPSLFVASTDSLAEQLQRALPDTKVVKAFNTVTARLQTDPGLLAHGDHHLFICGNDASAKSVVADIARSYSWENIIDLGDITNARGMEMIMPFWLELWGALKSPMFNYKIVTGK